MIEEETESSSVLPAESVEETDIAEEVEEIDGLQNESILENPTQVINDLNEWELTDIPVTSVPEDAGYIGATDNGFFYSWKDGNDRKYYFYSFSGEITCVFEEEIKEEGTYSTDMMTDNSLLLTLSHTEGVTTYQVFEDGTIEEIYTQTAITMPQ